MAKERDEETNVIPLFGKDEMNLIEFPFGLITSTATKTLEVEHQVFDRRLRREVTRRMIMTGADAFGLPKPVDDQVLVGMKTLTYEAGFASRKVEFSRYQLCRTIGWQPDGRAYARVEESFDRIAGTTLKFKDAWWDKGEKEWKSKTFHLIEEVDLCSRDRLDRKRAESGRNEQKLCSFMWTEVIWKSFQDGFIKTLDMTLYRRIAEGRRREVPLRLFRILDKRFHYGSVTKFELRRLCIGTLGLCGDYSPSQMARVLDRAGKWLIECEYLQEMWYESEKGEMYVYFRRRPEQTQQGAANKRMGNEPIDRTREDKDGMEDSLKLWMRHQCEEELSAQETQALEEGFGSPLERNMIVGERSKRISILNAGRTRLEYVRRFMTEQLGAAGKVARRA